MGQFIVLFVSTFCNVMSAAVLIYCVMSWFLPPYNEIRSRFEGFMSTFLDPIRRVMPRTGMIDFSPIVLLFGLEILEMLVRSIF